jgi:glutathione peroxidase-family protein
MKFTNISPKISTNVNKTIYDYSVKDYKNNAVSLEKYRNYKTVLIVNVASY